MRSLVLGAACAAVALLASPASAGTTDGIVTGAVKIVDRGPDGQRFNLVVIADGFRAAELPAFAAAAQSFADVLLATPPFDANLGVNIWRIDVASVDSGADEFPAGCLGAAHLARTYFDATFCAGGLDRLLTANASTAIDVLNAKIPEWDGALVIVNSTTYGGSGGRIGVTSLSGPWQQVAIHEMGHAFFGFADEYE